MLYGYNVEILFYRKLNNNDRVGTILMVYVLTQWESFWSLDLRWWSFCLITLIIHNEKILPLQNIYMLEICYHNKLYVVNVHNTLQHTYIFQVICSFARIMAAELYGNIFISMSPYDIRNIENTNTHEQNLDQMLLLIH